MRRKVQKKAPTENVGRLGQKNKENKKRSFYLSMILRMLAETLLTKLEKLHPELSSKKQTILIKW